MGSEMCIRDRDAPVGALKDHASHSVLAPCRDPADVLACAGGLVLEGIDRAEPLRSCAEDDRVLASPAMRIAVDDILGCEEHAALLHVVEDDGVTFVGAHSGVLAGVFGVLALIVDGNDHVHAVALAGDVVVRAEAGSGVDAAGAGVHGDVVGQNKAAGLGQEGVVSQHILKEAAGCVSTIS